MRNPRSLRRWLTGWLAALMLGGLGVACIAIYIATSQSIKARQDKEIEHGRESLQHLLDKTAPRDDPEALRRELDLFFDNHAGFGLRLTHNGGAPVYVTPSFEFSGAAELRWLAFELPSPWSARDTLRAGLALDVSADLELMRRLAWTLLAGALAGVALVSAGSAWLVWRALLPVRDLMRQAAALNPENVGQPLDGSAQARELQPLVAQFNALLLRVENAYQQLESFNAEVAHELRTPLATLIGETELALSRERGAAELRDVLGSNLEDLHRLAGLVNDMLFLSRADRGARARLAPVQSLAALAREVIEFHDAALQEAGLGATVRGDAQAACDVPLFRRAVSNLLANATRFAAPGSEIEIAIGPAGAGDIGIAVANRGPEIPAEYLPRLFERFSRAGMARERGDDSSHHGLGLAIVAAIVRMHGGSVFARSLAGGTTVGFNIPAGRETTPR
ncbi:MAG: heavy metal sensor histidine kinase [Azoarcus sp.]|jgi:two-component system heavy metal sensor histidine kinase CusS|nr:heavy metal sensor histidine kinase [Azoarcus sp.]